MKQLIALWALLGTLVISGCAPIPQTSSDPVGELALAIQSMGASVDPAEARRAAEISYSYATQLAQGYGVTTAPLVHNTKVNAGIKDRGLCFHYATDMQARLEQEGFKTLEILRAIAEPTRAFHFIDHSTAVIAARGDDIDDGVVLDAWRYGGDLFWSPTVEDTRYEWEPRMQVLERKRKRKRVAAGVVEG